MSLFNTEGGCINSQDESLTVLELKKSDNTYFNDKL